MSLRTPATLFGSAGCFSANGERPQNSTSHCKGVLITAGCLGSLVEKKSANLSFEYYQFNFEYRDTVRLIEPSVYRMDLQSFIYSGADEVLRLSDKSTQYKTLPEEGDLLERSTDGLPLLQNDLFRSTEQRSIRVEYTMITGSNWSGWIIEQIFSPVKKITKPPRKKQIGYPHPLTYTPLSDFRCIALIIGNDKMSMSMQPYCFLRKRVANLDIELSYDIFMDMVQTIRFNEGETMSDLKLTPTLAPALPSARK